MFILLNIYLYYNTAKATSNPGIFIRPLPFPSWLDNKTACMLRFGATHWHRTDNTHGRLLKRFETDIAIVETFSENVNTSTCLNHIKPYLWKRNERIYGWALSLNILVRKFLFRFSNI